MDPTSCVPSLPARARRSTAWLVSLTAALALAGLVPAGCAVNPATGERQLSLVGTEQEIAMGRDAAEQVRATMGLYGDPDLQSYVEELGTRMARDTERPDLPWSFAVVDEPVVNAFALPGGFIYFTRGIMAYFNSEAELAAVMGHEIGHVTARHSVEQMSRQQLAQIGLGVGAVLSEDVARFGDVLGAGLGLLFLKYGRDDERQSDRLGIRYMTAQGYDPREMADVFQMFQRQAEEAGGSGVPGWLSTHPTPASRIEEVRRMVDSLPDARVSGTRVEREAYLRRVDGMVFGPDPRNGYFQGDDFVHPALEIRLAFPGGWARQNMAQLVVAQGPEQDAQVRMSLAEGGSRREAARSFFSGQGVQEVSGRETTVNGFPAYVAELRAQGQQTTLRGIVAFVEDGSRTYQLLTVATASAYPGHETTFRRFVGSFRRLEDRDVLAAEPLRVRLVELESRTTVAEVASRRASPLEAPELALMNGVEVDEALPAGRLIKWVEGELPEAMRD